MDFVSFRSVTFASHVTALGVVSGIEQIPELTLYKARLDFTHNGLKNTLEIRIPGRCRSCVNDGDRVYLTGSLRQIYCKQSKKYVIFIHEITKAENGTEGYATVDLCGMISNLTYGSQGVTFCCEVKGKDQKMDMFKCYAYGRNAMVVANCTGYVSVRADLVGLSKSVRLDVTDVIDMGCQQYATDLLNISKVLHITPNELRVALFAFIKSSGMLPTYNDSAGRLIVNKNDKFIRYVNNLYRTPVEVYEAHKQGEKVPAVVLMSDILEEENGNISAASGNIKG